MQAILMLIPEFTHSTVALTTLAGGGFTGASNHLLHIVFSLGLLGVLLVSVIDSSFVPLPLPGITDIMLIVYAAQHTNPWMLVLIATIGSALGGWFSYNVGHSGGLAFIEKRTPPRIYKRVTRWMESHAVLAVALPALLPPPMPLSPFVLAAGALKMSLRTFMATFTVSRLIRHTAAVLLGVFYGKHVLDFWARFAARWGTPFLVVLWTGILLSVVYAFWQLWKTSKTLGVQPRLRRRPATS